MPDLTLLSLRGGLNDAVSSQSLADDECTVANNVEWYTATVGERRNGCEPVVITSSHLDDETQIVHLSQWFSSNQITVPEWWAVSATPGTSVTMAKRTAGTWSKVTPSDAVAITADMDLYSIISQVGPNSAAPNGKLFFAYKTLASGGTDRLHVWDPNNGSTLRRTGLAQPAAPTLADSGTGGTFANHKRYYRIRYVRESGVGAQVTVRSEPSVSASITPSGTKDGVVVTRPALLSEGEQYWEVEASFDNVLFYNIQSLAIATTSWTDVFTDPNSYSEEGTLSEEIGEYLLQHAAKFLAVDGDRLLMGGHWTDKSLQSTVWWTPVFADPGAGNDERLPLSTNCTRNLDNYAGGPLTGICSAIYGSWYAFKWEHIYKFVRTNDVTNAYSVLTVSTTRGAIPGSIVKGVDENGSACIYFLDPKLGPSRIGPGGLQLITGFRTTWKRINLQATKVIARAVYYAEKQQIHWWLAMDGADSPNMKLICQVTYLHPVPGGVAGGLSTADGRIAEAYTAAIFTELETVDGVNAMHDRPFIGLTDGGNNDYIQRCDVDVVDAGVGYVAVLRSKPFIASGLLNHWGAMCGAILVSPQATQSLIVKFIRDFGLERNEITTDLAPQASETLVIKTFDSLVMSNNIAMQIEFTDPPV